jgi:hypothetical protein
LIVTKAEAADVQPLAEDVTVYVPAEAVTIPVASIVKEVEGLKVYVVFKSKFEMAKLPVAIKHVGWVTFPRTTGTAGV